MGTHTRTSTFTVEEKFIKEAVESFEEPASLPDIFDKTQELIQGSEVAIGEELCATILGQLIQRNYVERCENESGSFTYSQT